MVPRTTRILAQQWRLAVITRHFSLSCKLDIGIHMIVCPMVKINDSKKPNLGLFSIIIAANPRTAKCTTYIVNVSFPVDSRNANFSSYLDFPPDISSPSNIFINKITIVDETTMNNELAGKKVNKASPEVRAQFLLSIIDIKIDIIVIINPVIIILSLTLTLSLKS